MSIGFACSFIQSNERYPTILSRFVDLDLEKSRELVGAVRA
jgi:hypothetical protein